MEAMKDEKRAEIIISMGLELRKDAAAALDPKTWERTMDVVKNNGAFAARCAAGKGSGKAKRSGKFGEEPEKFLSKLAAG